MPTEIVEEICGGTDDLAEWISDHENKVALELEEEADVALLRRVIEGGYAIDLDDKEIEIVGRDPLPNCLRPSGPRGALCRNGGSIQTRKSASKSSHSRCL